MTTSTTSSIVFDDKSFQLVSKGRWSTSSGGMLKKVFTPASLAAVNKLSFPKASNNWTLKGISPEKFPALAKGSSSVSSAKLGVLKRNSRLATIGFFASLLIFWAGGILGGVSGFLSAQFSMFLVVFGTLPVVFSLCFAAACADDLAAAKKYQVVAFTLSGWFNDAFEVVHNRKLKIESLYSSLLPNVRSEVFSAVSVSFTLLRDILVDMSLISKSLNEFLSANPESSSEYTGENALLLSKVHARLGILESSFVKVYEELMALEKEVLETAKFTAGQAARDNLNKAVISSELLQLEGKTASVEFLLQQASDVMKASRFALKEIAAFGC